MVKLRLASWNVRTVDDEVRRNNIFKELKEHNIDIACLQETKLLNHKFIGNDHTIFSPVHHTGKSEHGVGFAFKIHRFLTYSKFVDSEPNRLSVITLNLNNETIHIINVYAPTNSKDTKPEDKDYFYSCLEYEFSEIPPTETVFIIGDFNAKVGADNVAWHTCLGPYGVGKINDNGQRLLEFCSLKNLCVLNTYTDLKESEKFTHQHPGWKTWSQLDLCITRVRDQHKVITTRPVINLLNSFDHKMVILDIDTQLTVQNIEPNVAISQMETLFRYLLRSFVHIVIKKIPRNSSNAFLFQQFFYKNIIHIYDYSDVFEMLFSKITSFFDNQGSNNAPADFEYITYKIIKISQLFLKKEHKVSDNEFKMFFKEVERHLTDCQKFTPSETKNILKGELTCREKKYIIVNVDLYTQSNKEFDRLKYLTIEWCQDFVLPLELIFVFMYKQCSNIANFPTTSKNTDMCSTLLRLLAECMLTKLKSIVTDDILQQLDIFKCTSETDMLLALNLLQEKCLEKVVPLYIAFVDLSQILKGITPISVNCLTEEPQWALYLPLLFGKAEGNDIQTQTELLEFLLSHILAKSFHKLEAESLNKCEANLTLKYDIDGKLFDRSRLKANSKEIFRLRAIQYGGHATIFATTMNEIQQCIENIESTFNFFGLSFVQNEPSILAQNVEDIEREIHIDLETVFISIRPNVNFLGVNFTSDKFSLETEIFLRIHKAYTRLHPNSQDVDSLGLYPTFIYKNIILPNLMRHLEVLSLTDEQERALEKFHERCLRIVQLPPEPDGISKRIRSARMILLGTYHRDRSDSITKRILYGDLAVERKSVSYFRNLKKDLKSLPINVDQWELLAENERIWIIKIET